jgi:DNA-binding transcriptional MerR regulator
MTPRRQRTTTISISMAVRRTGLSRQVVQECTERRLVTEPLTDAELTELRRIRRLRELGVNLQGIEIILHMRRRILALQAELDRWERMGAGPGRAERHEWQRLLSWDPDDSKPLRLGCLIGAAFAYNSVL